MKKKNCKFGFTLIELIATLIIIIVVLAISVPLISNLIEIAKREAFRATAYSIVDSGRFLLASNKATNEEFYYRDGVQYNADNKKLDYSGKGPETGTVILNEKGSTVAIAIHNGTYCATKSADEKKVTVTKTTPDDCNAYTIIKTCDTWEEIALKYDVTLSALLKLNNETDSNSSTCGRDIKIPVSSTSSDSVVAGGGPTVYYKTYYTVGYVGYTDPYPGTNYEYTIQLGVLPLPAKDIEAVRVVSHSVFEELDDFKRYIVKKNMREVIWPGEEPKQIDISQASVFKDHAATSTNMTSDDVTVQCDNETCYATVAATVNNLNNVNPNTIDGYPLAYTPIKFTVEFNGEAEVCTVRTVNDAAPGTLAGTGTSADPYLVESIEDLVALSNNVNAGNSYSGKYISLTNTFDFKNQKSYRNYQATVFGDINGNGTVEGLMTELTTGSGIVPIGNSVTPFRGTLFGNLNCIYNLYVNRPTMAYVGFVGYNTGKITGLNLNNINITGANYTAGLAGFNGGSVINSTVNGDVTGSSYVGFAAGYVDYNTATTSIVANGNIKGVSNVGGLVGYDYTGASVRGVYSGGSVTGTGSSIGRTIGAMRGGSNDGTLAMNTITVNGSTVSSNSSTGTNGSSITSLADLNDINLSETAFDTYIGGDNDGDGYYWDYDNYGKVVRKSVQDSPISFSLSGSGTTADPYLIYNYDDLRQASLKQNVVYKLMSNIDLSGKNYYMLGSYQNKFSGTFDGNIKTISNMDINDQYGSYVGFIGYNNGKIMGLNLNNIDVKGANYTAGFVGFNGGSVINSTVSGDVTGSSYVGFAAGYVDYNTAATSIVANGNISGVSNVGGLIGYDYTGASVRGVYSGGSVVGTGSSIGRTIGAIRGGSNDGTLAMNTITVNGSTVNSNSSTGTNGANIISLSNLNDINLSETAFDTYIGGDNDGDGYYWDYDDTGKVVRKTVAANPIPFTLSGSGTAVAPYLINNYDELRQASLKQNVVYKLMSNIDLSGKNYYMLGSYQNKFSGTFDGNIKTLSNMDINDQYGSYVGFIGYNNGKIMGLNLNNIDVEGANYTAGLVGFNGGSVINSTVNGDVTGSSYVGFVAGYVDYNTAATSIVANGNISGVSNVGGLIGYDYTGASVRGVYSGGSVIGTGSSIGRTIGAIRGGSNDGTLAMNTITVNGSTVNSNSSTGTNGASITSLSNLNDINLSETAFDTYIGGDNDGDGYYWDYDDTGNVVRKTVAASPIPFILSGSGTIAAPYLIYNYDDLRQASLKQNVVYKLMADIDLSGKNYYMLGSYQNKFSGTFDGYAKTISNMTINNPYGSYVGFVGYNNGKITGLNLSNINVTGANYTSGIAGFDGGNISNMVISGNLSGASFVGFATGYIDYGKTATSIVVDGNVMGVSNVGGLVGYDYTGSTIKGVYRSGSVVGTSSGVSRTIGAMRGGSTDNTAVYSGITVNGITLYSASSSSTQGVNVSSSDLQLSTIYTNSGFNFTDEALNYIWYLDNGVAKFREGSL